MLLYNVTELGSQRAHLPCAPLRRRCQFSPLHYCRSPPHTLPLCHRHTPSLYTGGIGVRGGERHGAHDPWYGSMVMTSRSRQ